MRYKKITVESTKMNFRLLELINSNAAQGAYPINLLSDFLGAVINLGEPFRFHTEGWNSETFQRRHCNFLFLPKGSYGFIPTNRSYHFLLIHLDKEATARWTSNFPLLENFLKECSRNQPRTLQQKNATAGMRILKDLVDGLNFNSQDKEIKGFMAQTRVFVTYNHVLSRLQFNEDMDTDTEPLFRGKAFARLISNQEIKNETVTNDFLNVIEGITTKKDKK